MALGHARIALTFLSGASESTAVYISREHVSFELPTFTACGSAACCVYCKAAATESGTFYKVHEEGIYSAGSGLAPWELPNTAGALIVECTPASRHAWVKVALSTAATGGYVCYLHQHSPAK
jgi:hypothetical protein